MIDEKKHKTALERAARAIHESYYGPDSWKQAGAPERSHARQAVRLALGAVEKNGLSILDGGPGPKGVVPPRPAAQRRF